MTDNPIVDEIHRIREQILAEYGGDLRAFVDDMRRRTEEAARAGRKVASPNDLMKKQIQASKKAG